MELIAHLETINKASAHSLALLGLTRVVSLSNLLTPRRFFSILSPTQNPLSSRRLEKKLGIYLLTWT